MKTYYRILIVSAALYLAGWPPASHAGEATEASIATLYFPSTSMRVEFKATEDELLGTPIWNPDEHGDPPLSASAAWKTARAALSKSAGGELVLEHLSLYNIGFRPSARKCFNRWAYVVDAKPLSYSSGEFPKNIHLLTVVVLMSGKVVSPKFIKEGDSH